MPDSQIDIVIVTRDNPELLERLLQSLYANVAFHKTIASITIVDDASSDQDAYAKISESFPESRLVHRTSVCGPAANRNFGAQFGTSPYIAFLDDDVVPSKDWFATTLPFLEESTDIGSIGGLLLFDCDPPMVNSAAGEMNPFCMPSDALFGALYSASDKRWRMPYTVPYICSACILTRREAFDGVEGFDSSFFYMGEDFDYGLRLYAAGYRNLVVPTVLAYHRFHGTTGRMRNHRLQILYFSNVLAALSKYLSRSLYCKVLSKILNVAAREGNRAFIMIAGRLLINSIRLYRCRSKVQNSIRKKGYGENDIIKLNHAIQAHLNCPSTEPEIKWGVKAKTIKCLLACSKKIAATYRKGRDFLRGSVCVPKRMRAIIHVSNVCNLKCPFCFSVSPGEKARHLDPENIKRFFANSQHKIGEVILSGGEPFLYSQLYEICTILESTIQPKTITIPTNGSIPEDIYSCMKKILLNTRCRFVVSLSIDGPEDIHDAIREKPGLFIQAVKTYTLLEGLRLQYAPRLHLQVNATIMEENLFLLPELRKAISEFFPNATFSFEPLRQLKHAENHERFIDELRHAYADSMNDESITYSLPKELRTLALDTYLADHQLVPCIAGDSFIVIWPDGSIAPCEELTTITTMEECGYNLDNLFTLPAWMKAVEAIQGCACCCAHSCFLSASYEQARYREASHLL